MLIMERERVFVRLYSRLSIITVCLLRSQLPAAVPTVAGKVQLHVMDSVEGGAVADAADDDAHLWSGLLLRNPMGAPTSVCGSKTAVCRTTPSSWRTSASLATRRVISWRPLRRRVHRLLSIC